MNKSSFIYLNHIFIVIIFHSIEIRVKREMEMMMCMEMICAERPLNKHLKKDSFIALIFN